MKTEQGTRLQTCIGWAVDAAPASVVEPDVRLRDRACWLGTPDSGIATNWDRQRAEQGAPLGSCRSRTSR